ncbi:MAG TPA: hypothetical protein VMM12_13805 [Longimicrobiales bacterium]|nr:hypothetical protein [Longimicrobiales bacterium]
MRKRVIARALLALLAGAPATALAAQEDDGPVRISPDILALAEHPTLALRLEIALDRGLIDVAAASRLNASFDADLPFTWNADRNPETLEAGAAFGFLKALIRAPPPGPGGVPSLDPPTRWGFVEVSLAVAAEAAQARRSADVALGLEAAYEHDQDRLWFLPAAEAAFALVDCVGCDLPADESSWSRRIDARLRWSIPLAAVLPAPLDPLRLRPAGRWFHAWGAGDALAALRDEEGVWGSVELAYAIDGVPFLHEVHAGWRGGDLPVRLEQKSAWFFGITVIP